MSKDAVEPQLRYNEMRAAAERIPAEIEDLMKEAAAWGTASLRNMSTLALRLVPRSHSVSHALVGRDHDYRTLPSGAIDEEYERRTDKSRFPTFEELEEAASEAKEFEEGQLQYDEALREVEHKRRALESALPCVDLFMLADRQVIAEMALGLLGKMVHSLAGPFGWEDTHLVGFGSGLSGRGVMDQLRVRRKHLRDASTRYELSALSCELMYWLCCRLQACEMITSALEAVRAVEKLRHATSKGMQSLAGHTAGIIKEDCRDFLRIKEFEDVPLSILDDIEATPCDFSIAGGNGGPLGWDSIIERLRARIKKKEEAKERVHRLRSEIDKIVGRIEVALVISEVVGYVALAVSILRGGIGVWRKLVKKPPPRVPIGSGPPPKPPPKPPGKLVDAPSEAGMPRASAQYQLDVTGNPAGKAYEVRGVKFDGYDEARHVLLDAKARYAQFLDKKGDFKPFFLKSKKGGVPKMISDAKRQIVAAADGAPIEWHFAEREALEAVERIFRQEGIRGIKFVHTPPKRPW